MSYHLEPDNHIREEVKVVCGLPNYSAKKIIRTYYRCCHIESTY